MTRTEALAQMIAELLEEREAMEKRLEELKESKDFWLREYTKLERQVKEDE